jgi:pimeloyl-ACP methyl ester carboxylesterase
MVLRGAPSLPPFSWEAPQVLAALPHASWETVTFWHDIYDEVQQHFEVGGRPKDLLDPPVEALPEPPLQSWWWLRLPEWPKTPTQVPEAINVTKQLIQIALNDLPPDKTMSVYDLAFGVGKLAAANDLERVPTSPTGKDIVPRRVLEQGLRIGVLAHEIYFKTGEKLARDHGMECLQYRVPARPREPPYAVLRRGAEVVVMLKGSTGPDDALTCLDALSVPFPADTVNPRNFAHAGFAEVANWMDSEVKQVIDEAAADGMMWLTFTGHSLGGAVANLLAVQYEFRYPFVNVRSVGLAAPPCMSPSLAKRANRISLNFVNGFDIVPRASVLAAKHVLNDLLDLQAAEATSERPGRPASFFRTEQPQRFGRLMAKLIRDANRTRTTQPCPHCSAATQVHIVQNGEDTLRYATSLKPLDFYHIEHLTPDAARGNGVWGDGGAVVRKRSGSELERIDLTRHGLISDHIAGRYISRLRDAVAQESVGERKRRIGAAFPRGGWRRRKLVPPLQVASSR